MSEREQDPSAESLFLSWVLEARRDEAAFESLRREHPAHAARLERLWLDWSEAQRVLTAPPDRSASRLVEGLARTARGPERYDVRDELGHGGMGTVLRVWDEALGREAAMKTLRERGRDDVHAEARRSRFLQEAQVTGQLEHPGIVPVHDIGLDGGGKPYFTMSLVRGRDLSSVIDDTRAERDGWTLTRAVEVLLRVCDAMSYAHDKGVLHRDLKPANIRVGSYGEVFVMDWGLARVGGAEAQTEKAPAAQPSVRSHRADAKESGSNSPLVTQDGTVIGTPHYMAPEQARGDGEAMDQRTDVYAVGAILYHLLVGHSPYAEEGRLDAMAALARVTTAPPPALERLAPHAPPELVAICNRAMARQRRDRYVSMGELAGDLRAWLEGRVVRAHRTGAWAELQTWTRRNRGLAASLAALFLALVGVAVSETMGRLREERAKEQAIAERENSDHFAEVLSDILEDNPFVDDATGAVEVLDEHARTILEDETRPPLSRARMLHQIGRTMTALWDPPRAEPHFRHAFEIRLAELGPADPDTLASSLLYSRALVSLGRVREGEDVARASLRASHAEYGGDHEETAACAETVAFALHTQGQLREAAVLMEQAAAQRRASLPRSDSLLLNTEVNLVHVYLWCGRTVEAEELARAVVAKCEEYLGEGQTTTHEAREVLARVLANTGKRDEAEELMRLAHVGRRALLGPAHPRTLDLEEGLASMLLSRGKLPEAQRFARRAFEERRRMRPISYPATVLSALALTETMEAFGNTREAEEFLLTLVGEGIEEEGELTVELAILMSDIARLQLQRGAFEEAEGIEREILELRREKLGPTNHHTYDSMDNLARVFAETDRLDQAEALRREALAGRRTAFGDRHSDVAESLRELGAFLLDEAGRPQDALAFCAEAVDLFTDLMGPEHPETMDARALAERCQNAIER